MKTYCGVEVQLDKKLRVLQAVLNVVAKGSTCPTRFELRNKAMMSGRQADMAVERRYFSLYLHKGPSVKNKVE
jgi:hypothetical protein